MITFSTIPAVILAKDPLWVTLAGSFYKQQEGTKAVIDINLSALPVTADTIEFTLFGTKKTFTVTDSTPIEYYDEVRLPEQGESVWSYISSVLYPLLRDCALVNSFFDVTLDLLNQKIVLTAIQAQTFIVTDYVFFAGHENAAIGISTLVTIGSADIMRENYRLNYRIIRHISATNATSTEVVTGWQSVEPNANGSIDIDMHELLEQLVATSFDAETTEKAINLPNDCLHYNIQAFESWIDNGTPRQMQAYQTPNFYVIEGGSSKSDQKQWNENSTIWWDVYTTGKQLLTKAPAYRIVTPDQPVYLKFINNIYTVVTVKVKKIAQNGTENISSYTSFTALSKKVFQVNVSPMAVSVGSTIVRYQVWFESGSGASISNILTFDVDRSTYNNVRYLFFRNSLGGYDTIAALGISQVDAKYTRENTLQVLPKGFTRLNRENITTDVVEEIIFKVNTGFLVKMGEGREAWANYLRELYLSTDVYEFVNGGLEPITITSDKQKLLDDEDYLPSFELEYTRAFIESNAPSEIPNIAGDYGIDYSDDYNIW